MIQLEGQELLKCIGLGLIGFPLTFLTGKQCAPSTWVRLPPCNEVRFMQGFIICISPWPGFKWNVGTSYNI